MRVSVHGFGTEEIISLSAQHADSKLSGKMPDTVHSMGERWEKGLQLHSELILHMIENPPALLVAFASSFAEIVLALQLQQRAISVTEIRCDLPYLSGRKDGRANIISYLCLLLAGL